MSDLLYIVALNLLLVVWLAAIAGVWSMAEKSLGKSRGKTAGVVFAILMTVFSMLAYSAIKTRACESNIDFEVC